jgi:hypothetical protein
MRPIQIFQFFANLKLKELIDLLLPIVSTQMAQLLVRNCEFFLQNQLAGIIRCHLAAQCLGPLKTDLERMVSRVQYATKTMDDLEAFYVSNKIYFGIIFCFYWLLGCGRFVAFRRGTFDEIFLHCCGIRGTGEDNTRC